MGEPGVPASGGSKQTLCFLRPPQMRRRTQGPQKGERTPPWGYKDLALPPPSCVTPGSQPITSSLSCPGCKVAELLPRSFGEDY